MKAVGSILRTFFSLCFGRHSELNWPLYQSLNSNSFFCGSKWNFEGFLSSFWNSSEIWSTNKIWKKKGRSALYFKFERIFPPFKFTSDKPKKINQKIRQICRRYSNWLLYDNSQFYLRNIKEEFKLSNKHVYSFVNV